MPITLRNSISIIWHLPQRGLLALIACYQATLSPDHPTSPSGLRRTSGPLTQLTIHVIELYQKTLSPDHGPLRSLHPYGFCRHHPTCSTFARQAIVEKGVIYGGLLSIQRILSCTPWKAPSEERIMEVCYGKKFCEKLVS